MRNKIFDEIDTIEKQKTELERKESALKLKVKEELRTEAAQFDIAVGRVLKRWREENRWTLDEALELSGIDLSRSSLSAIEHGQQRISLSDVYFLVGNLYENDVDGFLDDVQTEISQQV